MILDGAGRHASDTLAIPDNMRLVPLPPYPPKLNPMEQFWDNLREKSFHNRTFETIDTLEEQLEASLRERKSNVIKTGCVPSLRGRGYKATYCLEME